MGSRWVVVEKVKGMPGWAEVETTFKTEAAAEAYAKTVLARGLTLGFYEKVV